MLLVVIHLSRLHTRLHVVATWDLETDVCVVGSATPYTVYIKPYPRVNETKCMT
jgi:hypothetical protein